MKNNNILTKEKYLILRKENKIEEILDFFLAENPNSLTLFISVPYQKLVRMAKDHYDNKYQVMYLIQRYPNGEEEILEIFSSEEEGGDNEG